MKNKITRRDFLNGTQIAIGASLLSPMSSVLGKPSTQEASSPAYYPPAKTGMRGSHNGSWETMHAFVEGDEWTASEVEEQYDLVVVGAGLSGLSAAHFYRKEYPNARILLLENHDDFGGHAKRNEFSINGETRIGYGGTEAIDTPSGYSEMAKDMLIEIGIDVDKFYEAFDGSVYSSLGLSKGILFDKKQFGEQKLVSGYKAPWEEFAANAPFNEQARKDFIRIQTETRDYLPGMSMEDKFEKMRRVGYETFLRDWAKVDEQVIAMYQHWGMSFWGVGIKDIPTSSIITYNGMPGMQNTLKRDSGRGSEPYIHHFPDGNASMARLLVRKLIPEAIPGSTMEDVVTAVANYAMLDDKDQDVRLRLNSTAVNVQHTTDSKAVDVTYVNNAIAHKVRAKKCILACYHVVIPFIAPELPEKQKEALAFGIKVPLTYVKVLVPNWKAFANLGLDYVFYTNRFFKQVELDFPISLGDYKCSKTPDDPMILHMIYVPLYKNVSGDEQWRRGRLKLLATPFSTFERHVKSQLNDALAAGGFDADRDIRAITVNRWPHGDSYKHSLLWVPDYDSDDDKPWIQGRKTFGRIAIAAAESDYSSSTHGAIMQAWRAVQEISDA